MFVRRLIGAETGRRSFTDAGRHGGLKAQWLWKAWGHEATETQRKERADLRICNGAELGRRQAKKSQRRRCKETQRGGSAGLSHIEAHWKGGTKARRRIEKRSRREWGA